MFFFLCIFMSPDSHIIFASFVKHTFGTLYSAHGPSPKYQRCHTHGQTNSRWKFYIPRGNENYLSCLNLLQSGLYFLWSGIKQLLFCVCSFWNNILFKSWVKSWVRWSTLLLCILTSKQVLYTHSLVEIFFFAIKTSFSSFSVTNGKKRKESAKITRKTCITDFYVVREDSKWALSTENQC